MIIVENPPIPNKHVASDRVDWNYRVYTEVGLPVETYKKNHQLQTLEYVLECKQKFGSLNVTHMSIWDAILLLNSIRDESDPDNELPQIMHSYQTAEKLREIWPDEKYDWLHLTGFIHDLGKVLATLQWGNQPQWAVVGDTFPVGCRYSPKNVYPHLFDGNPDMNDPRYQTEFGIYHPNCGFDSVHMSWGHDEYLYQVLKKNNTLLPEESLYIIRYHSFYPWHREAAYSHLASEKDIKMLSWLQNFSNCDLYSKSEKDLNSPEIEAYYKSLIKKYFPNEILSW